MASTRNKNTRGNYVIELNRNIQSQDYLLNKEYSEPVKTMCPGNGLGGSYIPRTQMSENPIEIESFLFGIGSTNLTKQEPPAFDANLKCLPTNNLFTMPEVVVPKKFVANTNQRPQFH